MSKTFSELNGWEKLVAVCGLLFIGLFVYGLFLGASTPTEPTQAAKDNTTRNAFISACTGADTSSSFCGCAYDRLLVMYPDLVTNKERINRISTEGYNSTETDAMVTCYNQPTVLEN